MLDLTKPRSCYVVSAAGVDTDDLRRTLTELAITALSPADTAPVGQSAPRNLRQKMRKVDFIIGVLEDSRDRENVLFELGVAAGLNRPLFLLVPPGVKTNFALQSYPQVKASLDDVNVIVFHLRQFLRNIGKGSQPTFRVADTSSKQRPVPAWIQELASTADTLSERKLTEQIALALTASGMTTSIEVPIVSAEQAHRLDIVAWFDAAPASFGNPLIIEVRREFGQAGLDAVDKAKTFLKAANLRTAIVVAGRGAPEIRFEPADDGYVFVLSAERFLKELAQGSLFETLVRQRNLAAHGGSR